jgi:transposase-like protein
MGKKSQKFTPAFKAQVALCALQNQMTINEIIEKYGVSKSIVYKWKEEFVSNAANVFAVQKEERDTEKQIDNLHRKIGELEMELDFAKRVSKKLGI